MNKKFIKCLFMFLAVGLMYTPYIAKADQLVVMPISAPLSQEGLKIMPISTQEPAGITTNKTDFDIVEADKAPEILMEKINIYIKIRKGLYTIEI